MKANATSGNARFRIVEFTNPSGALACRVTRQAVRGLLNRYNEA
jgi:hypothetical protein